jgi:hypothetical protein
MFVIERLVGGVWELNSSHTKLADAEAQWTRAVEWFGVNNLRQGEWKE